MAFTTQLSYTLDGQEIVHPPTLPQQIDTALAHIADLIAHMRASGWDEPFKIEVKEI